LPEELKAHYKKFPEFSNLIEGFFTPATKQMYRDLFQDDENYWLVGQVHEVKKDDEGDIIREKNIPYLDRLGRAARYTDPSQEYRLVAYFLAGEGFLAPSILDHMTMSPAVLTTARSEASSHPYVLWGMGSPSIYSFIPGLYVDESASVPNSHFFTRVADNAVSFGLDQAQGRKQVLFETFPAMSPDTMGQYQVFNVFDSNYVVPAAAATLAAVSSTDQADINLDGLLRLAQAQGAWGPFGPFDVLQANGDEAKVTGYSAFNQGVLYAALHTADMHRLFASQDWYPKAQQWLEHNFDGTSLQVPKMAF
jgi:hypothetical protein